MWESRVLCEISKFLWKSFCDFHRNVISTAACEFSNSPPQSSDFGGYLTLGAAPIVIPGASCAVVFRTARQLMARPCHQRRRLGTKGPDDRPRRFARGVDGAGDVGRDRSVR